MANVLQNTYLRDICITKGDTLSFCFQIEGLGSNVRPDEIFFSCKEEIDSESYVFRKSLDDGISLYFYDSEHDILTYNVVTAPSDTQTKPLGSYFYDLSVKVLGNVYTFMKGRFNITWEVNENA